MSGHAALVGAAAAVDVYTLNAAFLAGYGTGYSLLPAFGSLTLAAAYSYTLRGAYGGSGFYLEVSGPGDCGLNGFKRALALNGMLLQFSTATYGYIPPGPGLGKPNWTWAGRNVGLVAGNGYTLVLA